ncbi:HNH endonuclease [Nocardioides cavernaquae]|uniref:DUF222 domain-containing protein n=1 Tax=Nocardioides cavernaquae TaxID=2321396 RepID=A0A3A5HA20_9ACTN|nr:DUF222 domain-containing protein [Nocardioides cavernaquae]RJS47473.1 DUF222 domain-containing protein [Nocardioides cavernaquae]
MFEPSQARRGPAPAGPFGVPGGVPAGVPVGAAAVQSWTSALLSVSRALDDGERIDLLRALEELTCAAAGAQVMVTADFDASQRAEQAAQGVPVARQGRGVASQVALARRESPFRGRQHLGMAKVLPTEMPHTLTALRAGLITEDRAKVLLQETACLTLENRITIDRAIAGDPEALSDYSDKQLIADVHRLAYKLEPGSVIDRRAKAEADRRVTLRPAPDVMSQLSALLPVTQGVAVFAALSKEADRLRAAGDGRSRGQLMADLLVTRVTGAAPVTPGGPPVVPVAINLVVSDQTLLGGSDDPAHVDGFGQIPADLARQLAHDTLDAGLKVWLRRLYASPDGRLVAMDSRARLFPKLLAKLMIFRDRVCRTKWCGAPIRHLDHALDHDQGGPTSARNGQGLCEMCNHAKEAPNWRAGPSPHGPPEDQAIVTTTPTGHSYVSRPPRAPTPYDGAA